jgi:putative DNA primase/helicase
MNTSAMIPPVDEATVRQFIGLISEHVKSVINGANPPGSLQLCRINPLDEKSVVPSRFEIGDVEHMVLTALGDAAAGHNVYIEARTVRADLRGSKRGRLEDTAWVFGLVADCDADKNKGGNITVRPSLAVETSPGNFQLWYLFTRAITAAEAKVIGDALRASSGTDQDTGVITQCYRVAGTPNFPSTAKRARGRLTVEPTRIFQHTGRLWDPGELLRAFTDPVVPPPPGPQPPAQPQSAEAQEATLPAELLEVIRNGFAAGSKVRSDRFHATVRELWLRNWALEAVVALLEKYPNGIAEKYVGRIPGEAKRSYDKFVAEAGGAQPQPATPATSPPPPPPPQAQPAQPQPQPQQQPFQRVKPTIDLRAGELPLIMTKVEDALIKSGLPIFSRGRFLMRPVYEKVAAADGRRTVVACLHRLSSHPLRVQLANAAVFQRYDGRKKRTVVVDPPVQLAQALVELGGWDIPHVRGIATTPTLRADGSLFSTPGYDPQTQFYLLSDLVLPAIPAQPTRDDAEAALELLCGLFVEFAFVDKVLDRSVALAALLTTLVRSALPIAPMALVHAHMSGTGKSYLVDLIATIATGRDCPVVALAGKGEENEKRIGAMVLGGAPIISFDNCNEDLDDSSILCHVTERSRVSIRVLGRSLMPECDVTSTVFATGNNITVKGQLGRRTLRCNLDARSARPELREFKKNPLADVLRDRGSYVAAALTIIRAYLVAGEPGVCGPLGSYAAWSRMVRSPLVWLGQPDPYKSADQMREEDSVLGRISEFFSLWNDVYGLSLDFDHTSARIVETFSAPLPGFNPLAGKLFLVSVAPARDGMGVSHERFGWWLRSICGRIVDGYRLERSRILNGVATFRLTKV